MPFNYDDLVSSHGYAPRSPICKNGMLTILLAGHCELGCVHHRFSPWGTLRLGWLRLSRLRLRLLRRHVLITY